MTTPWIIWTLLWIALACYCISRRLLAHRRSKRIRQQPMKFRGVANGYYARRDLLSTMDTLVLRHGGEYLIERRVMPDLTLISPEQVNEMQVHFDLKLVLCTS
jgi:hypothetical protein